MGDENWRMLTEDELEKVAQELVVSFETYFVCKTDCFLLSHMVRQVEVN